jgi:hypothetical protein
MVTFKDKESFSDNFKIKSAKSDEAAVFTNRLARRIEDNNRAGLLRKIYTGDLTLRLNKSNSRYFSGSLEMVKSAVSLPEKTAEKIKRINTIRR